MLTSVDSLDRREFGTTIISTAGLRGSRRVLLLGRLFPTLIGRTLSGSCSLVVVSFDSGYLLFREGNPVGLSLKLQQLSMVGLEKLDIENHVIGGTTKQY